MVLSSITLIELSIFLQFHMLYLTVPLNYSLIHSFTYQSFFFQFYQLFFQIRLQSFCSFPKTPKAKTLSGLPWNFIQSIYYFIRKLSGTFISFNQRTWHVLTYVNIYLHLMLWCSFILTYSTKFVYYLFYVANLHFYHFCCCFASREESYWFAISFDCATLWHFNY